MSSSGDQNAGGGGGYSSSNHSARSTHDATALTTPQEAATPRGQWSERGDIGALAEFRSSSALQARWSGAGVPAGARLCQLPLYGADAE